MTIVTHRICTGRDKGKDDRVVVVYVYEYNCEHKCEYNGMNTCTFACMCANMRECG